MQKTVSISLANSSDQPQTARLFGAINVESPFLEDFTDAIPGAVPFPNGFETGLFNPFDGLYYLIPVIGAVSSQQAVFNPALPAFVFPASCIAATYINWIAYDITNGDVWIQDNLGNYYSSPIGFTNFGGIAVPPPLAQLNIYIRTYPVKLRLESSVFEYEIPSPNILNAYENGLLVSSVNRDARALLSDDTGGNMILLGQSGLTRLTDTPVLISGSGDGLAGLNETFARFTQKPQRAESIRLFGSSLQQLLQSFSYVTKQNNRFFSETKNPLSDFSVLSAQNILHLKGDYMLNGESWYQTTVLPGESLSIDYQYSEKNYFLR